jgi:hypothetical protein
MNGGITLKKDNMDKFNFFNRRKSFEINTIIKGLGIVVKTKSFLNEIVSGVNVFKLSPNGEDIYANISKNYQIGSRAFQADGNKVYNNGTPVRDLADVITSWEDLDGSMASIQNNEYIFRRSALRVLKLPSLKNLDQAFDDMINIEEYEFPSLEHINCSSFGSNNSNIFVVPPSVTSIGVLEKFNNFDEDAFVNVTELSDRFPFSKMPNLTSIKQLDPDLIKNNVSRSSSRSLMFYTNNLEGVFEFPLVTSLNSRFAFYRAQSITSLKLQNVTEINASSTFKNGGQSLSYLDIRKCNTITSSNIFSSFPNNGTLEAHIDLKTSNSGAVYENIQFLIDKNWTVNWYNADGSLNSTTNP